MYVSPPARGRTKEGSKQGSVARGTANAAERAQILSSDIKINNFKGASAAQANDAGGEKTMVASTK